MDLKKLRRNAGRSRQAEGGRALPSARSQRPWAVPRHRAARGVLLFAALDLDEGHGVIPRCHPLPLSRFSTQTRTGWSATPLALVQRYRDDVVPQDEAVVLGVLDDGLVGRAAGGRRGVIGALEPGPDLPSRVAAARGVAVDAREVGVWLAGVRAVEHGRAA